MNKCVFSITRLVFVKSLSLSTKTSSVIEKTHLFKWKQDEKPTLA